MDDEKHQRHMEGMKREGHAFRWFLLVLVVGFLIQEFWPGKPRPQHDGPCEISSGPMKSCDD